MQAMGKRLICKIYDFAEETNGIVVLNPAPFGMTKTQHPHRVAEVLGVGDECKGQVKVGDWVLLEGMNTMPIPGDDEDRCTPLEAAVLGVFDSAPGVLTDNAD